MAKYDVYVVGMRVEKFVDEVPGEDIFDMVPDENDKYSLFCITAEGRVKLIISLITRYGWCGSGYTTASWGDIEVEHVKEFGPATHLPKDRKQIKINGVMYDASGSIGKINAEKEGKMWLDGLVLEGTFEEDEDEEDWEERYFDCEIANNVFYHSSDGGDGYYPCGGAGVNLDLFTKIPRAFEKRPVWIFKGNSGSGKSTIGWMLSENSHKTVYETDSAINGDLPEEIMADVIVIGNKWKLITLDEIVRHHLPEDCKPIIVDFSHSFR